MALYSEAQETQPWTKQVCGMLTAPPQRVSLNFLNPALWHANADDQAETVVMRISRGSGIDGLAGMAAASQLPHLYGRGDASGTKLLRPLLGVPRSELRRLLLESGVLWIDDPTNDDRGYSRNMVRHLLQEKDTAMQTAKADTVSKAAAVGKPAIALDVLRLQRRCAKAQAQLQHQAAQLMRACLVLEPARQPATKAAGSDLLALLPLAAAPRPVVVRMLAVVLQVTRQGVIPPMFTQSDF